MKFTKMAIITKDNFRTIKLTVKALISGQMPKYLKVSGSTLGNTASASGRALMETAMRESGEITKWMAMGCMSGPMETSMKVNGE